MLNRFILALGAAAAVVLSIAGFTAGNVVLGTLTPAVAQTAPGPNGGQGGAGGRRGNQQFAKMLLTLNLSDDQKNKIRAIMADARAKSKTLTDAQAKRDAFRAGIGKIDGVLTPDQLKKLQAERNAFRAQHPSGPGNS